MSFTFSDWKERIVNRSDITGMLTHLTRPSAIDFDDNEETINRKSVDNLIRILSSKCLNGSTTSSGFIIGCRPAVCFQDAPLYGIAQNVVNEQRYRQSGNRRKIRYTGNGLLFSKFYVYGKGGRPVIYDSKIEAKKYMDKDNYWRIVNFVLSVEDQVTIDWTHEREWRVPDCFEFKYDFTHVLVNDKESYDYFIKNCSEEILRELHGITILKSLLM